MASYSSNNKVIASFFCLLASKPYGLKPLIIGEKGKTIVVKPQIVVSILYDEIQRSPSYSSGFALRFPRVVTLRTDRTPMDVASLEDLENIACGFSLFARR